MLSISIERRVTWFSYGLEVIAAQYCTTALVHYFAVGIKQEYSESDRPLSVKLTSLIRTLSPISHTPPT